MSTVEDGESDPLNNFSPELDDVSLTEGEKCACKGIITNKRVECTSLQCFAGIHWVLFFLCIATLLHESLIGGLYGVCVSTIQKRFELHSAESGLIAVCYDIAMCFSLLIIPYYGGKGSTPKWIGWGVFIMGLGSITVAIPHFIAPTYEPTIGLDMNTLCNANISTKDICGDHTLRIYRFVFMGGIAFAGIGGTALTTLAFTYMDENVEQRDSSLYSGIYLACGSIGPGLGYFIGGPLLGVYTNLGTEPYITPNDSLWIGAWWAGFIIVGVCSLVVSSAIMMLPEALSTRPIKQKMNAKLEEPSKSEKEIISELCHNTTYILITLGTAANFAFVYGANTFAAKYLESMFGIGPGMAAIYFGISTIIGAAFAMALSGAIISKFNLTQLGMIKFMVACALFSALCSLGFLIKCPEENYGKLHEGRPHILTDIESCNIGCNCTKEIYTPICGDDDVTYFSPCFAGCNIQENATYYRNCTCISHSSHSATLGKCKPSEECYMLTPFIISIFFCFFSSILTVPPSIQVTMRCVDFESRSVALGIQRILVIVFGIVPGRIVAGKLIDLTCTVWGTHCDERGSCRVHSRNGLSTYLTIFAVVETGLCFLFYLVTWKCFKKKELSEIGKQIELDDFGS